MAINSSVFAAEDIVHNGKEGTFFEKAAAAKLLEAVKVELPKLQAQNALLEQDVNKHKELVQITNKRLETEEQISSAWKKNFEGLSERTNKQIAREDVRVYVNLGIFVVGAIVGGGIFYAASVALNNIK